MSSTKQGASAQDAFVLPPPDRPTDEHYGGTDGVEDHAQRGDALGGARLHHRLAAHRGANSASSWPACRAARTGPRLAVQRKGAHLVNAHGVGPHRANVGAVVEHTFAALQPQREHVQQRLIEPVSTPSAPDSNSSYGHADVVDLRVGVHVREASRRPHDRAQPGTRACRRGRCQVTSAARPGCARAARARRSAKLPRSEKHASASTTVPRELADQLLRAPRGAQSPEPMPDHQHHAGLRARVADALGGLDGVGNRLLDEHVASRLRRRRAAFSRWTSLGVAMSAPSARPNRSNVKSKPARGRRARRRRRAAAPTSPRRSPPPSRELLP